MILQFLFSPESLIIDGHGLIENGYVTAQGWWDFAINSLMASFSVPLQSFVKSLLAKRSGDPAASY
jgi:hypothetical protein